MQIKLIFAMALTPFLVYGAQPEPSPSEKCQSPFHVMHVDVRHTESKGVGYKDGYTTFEGFGIYDHNPYFMPFLDLRGHVFNDGKLAGNIGLGERTVIPSINHIFGLYLYYDVRQEDHGLTVNQLSPGIEMLGKRMEYRINAYFPIGNDESHGYQYKFNRFQGNRIVLQNKKKFAMTGADAEVGAHITQSTRHDFYFGMGPYYFTNAWGGKTRLYWRYKDYVSLEASYSYDHIFKNIVQGTVMFSYPFGPKLKRKGRNCPNNNDLALSRAAFAPYRFEIPVVKTRKQHSIARNAAGQPLRVWFVRNTSSSNGTYESPFSTLAAAQNASGPSDMIYVFQGDGTTRGMNAGITLKNGQNLFGSGTQQTINTSKGRVSIPAQTRGAPTITNGAGTSVVTLANGNEVSGFQILIPGATDNDRAISGTSVNGMNIHHNVIIDASAPALFVLNFGINVNGYGNLSVAENLIRGSMTTGDLSTGVRIEVKPGPFSNIRILNNTVTGTAIALDIDAETLRIPSTANYLISGNVISGFLNSGILMGRGVTNSTYHVNFNTINNTRALQGGTAGLSVISNNDIVNQSSYFISNNTVLITTDTGSAGGIAFVQDNNAGSSTRASMTDNIVIDNRPVVIMGPVPEISISVRDGNTTCATVRNNRISIRPSPAQGIFIEALGSGVINIDDLSNNISQGNLTSGTVALVPAGTCGQ